MIDAVEVRCYTVPADAPEADGTLAWDSTTMVLVQASAAPSSAPWDVRVDGLRDADPTHARTPDLRPLRAQ
jgi:hypothetical protein